MLTALKRIIAKDQHYRSWEDACAAAAGSYSDELVNGFRYARFKANRAAGHRVSILGTPLYWLCRENPEMSIVDFGGATGEFALETTKLFPGVRYTVVENPTLVRLMRGEIDGVEYRIDIPEVFDCFLSSGTIQYVPDPYGALETGFRRSKHNVALLRNCFSEDERFSVQQSPLFNNGGGLLPSGFHNETISYPHRTIVEERVGRIAQQHGFELVFRGEESSGAIGENSYGAQMVFLRK